MAITYSFSLLSAIRLVVLLITFLEAVTGQPIGETGVLSILVLNRNGDLLQKEASVDVNAEGLHKHSFIQTRGFFDLPYGTYTVRCRADNMIGSTRVVIIRQPRTQLVFALTPKEADQIMGEGDLVPWVIKGKLTPPPVKGKITIARLISLYSDVLEDAVVGEDGNFTLYAWRWSPYKLWILSGGRRLAERDIDVSPDLLKDAPRFEIHLDESNPRE